MNQLSHADAAKHHRGPPKLAALIGVLGVVYGDIGTSPLYAFKATLALIGGHA